MSEVKREFWLYDVTTQDHGEILAAFVHHKNIKGSIHVVSMSWHEQEMERVKKQLREYEHECETVQEMQSQVKSLTAMLDKMEKALGFYGASAGTWFSMTDGGKQYVCIDVSDHEYRPNNEMMIKYAGLKAREALKELADFRGSK